MKKLYLITLYLALMCNTAFAQPASVCVFEFCNAVLPKTAGEKVTGKDNCGNYCSKHGIAVAAPTAPPVTAKPETAIVPKETPIAPPAKDLLRSPGNVGGITVTLSTNAKNEPVMSAFCEKEETGINRWDVQMYKMGYHQVHKEIGDTVVTSYEK